MKRLLFSTLLTVTALLSLLTGQSFATAFGTFSMRFERLDLVGPFSEPLIVTITHQPATAIQGIDRVGTIEECKVTTNAILCVRRS